MVARVSQSSSEPPDDSDERPVDRNPVTGDIVIRFGQLEPIEVPPDVAIKFALLLLKEAGCVIKETPGGFIAIRGQRKPHGH